MLLKFSFQFFASAALFANAFQPSSLRTSHSDLGLVSSTSLNILPVLPELSEIGIESFALEGLDLALALTSASLAGVVSQWPQLSQSEDERMRLKVELEEAKTGFIKARNDLDSRVSQFEDSIFEMDKEFEQQTVEIKDSYEKTLSIELEVLKNKLKTEFETKTKELEETYEKDMSFQLELQGNYLKQNFLQDKIKFMLGEKDESRRRVSNLLANQAKVTAANKELEETIVELQYEIEAFRAKRTLVDFLMGKKR